jgi:hypothetical protein
VTKISVDGPAYDTIIRSESPVGVTNLLFEGLQGMVFGDRLLVTYDNPDSVSITGTAVVELIHGHTSEFNRAGLTGGDGKIRSLFPFYADVQHLTLTSFDPGGSGATFLPENGNHLAGWLLDSPTEELFAEMRIDQNWENSLNPSIDSLVTIMIAGTLPGDVLKFESDFTYANTTDPNIRTQTITTEAIVGAIPQYTRLPAFQEIYRNIVDNEIKHGDVINVRLRLASDSDISAILINDATFYYPTTHVGNELGFS